MTKKLWAGRFLKRMAKSAEDFTASIDYDQRLAKYDILGSIAYAKALEKAHILSEKEAKKIVKALEEMLKGVEAGGIKFKKELEDIHMNIEVLLTEKVGEAGQKLHTGRSRNDQVATDLRMYLREETVSILELIRKLQKTLLSLAGQNIKTVMPGYTHTQRAQPVLLAHHLLAYFEMLQRDKERLQDCYRRINVLPLGSSALAGSGFPIDREFLAKELGFAAVSKNSMDAVSDRDFVVEFISALSVLMMHLSRFCEELVLWSTFEFGFIELSDAYATGSSIMPQKKNPDIAELVRGKTGRVYGHLISLLTTLKALPLAYNRDLQEDKEAVFDTIDQTKVSLSILSEMLPSLKINKEKMEVAVRKGFLTATDLVDYLVRKGVPFRQAHEIVGKIVVFCIEHNMELEYLTLKDLKEFSGKFEMDVSGAITTEASLRGKDVLGGTAPERVKKAFKEAIKRAEI